MVAPVALPNRNPPPRQQGSATSVMAARGGILTAGERVAPGRPVGLGEILMSAANHLIICPIKTAESR
jgi:hypothetical protein